MADKNKALLMVLGKPKAPGATAAGDDEATEGEGDNYDADLDAAIADFADALGITVRDPEKAREAYKAMHDICTRAREEGP